jgi:hypothetical protein
MAVARDISNVLILRGRTAQAAVHAISLRMITPDDLTCHSGLSSCIANALTGNRAVVGA